MAPDEGDDGQVGHEGHVAPSFETVDRTSQGFGLNLEVVLAVQSSEARVFGMIGHGTMDFGQGDEIDRKAVLVVDGEDRSEEALRSGPFVGVYVKHRNLRLGCDRRRSFWLDAEKSRG
jgi:hypothetical protein